LRDLSKSAAMQSQVSHPEHSAKSGDLAQQEMLVCNV
jgi:hypothetical protein